MNRATKQAFLAGCVMFAPGGRSFIHVRKHRKPFEGRVTIRKDSSFRKLARAARRRLVPPEHAATIVKAMKKAALRKDVYRNTQRRGPCGTSSLSSGSLL